MAASAQYVIDIAATMSGGAQTSAELDRLSETLMGGGKGAEQFQVAIKSLSDQLSAAQARSAAANTALAAGATEYATLEKAAVQAAKAVEQASAQLALRDETKAKADAAAAAVTAYASTLGQAKAAAAAASGANAELNDALSEAVAEYARLEKASKVAAGAAAKAASKYGDTNLSALQQDALAAERALGAYGDTLRGLEDDADRASRGEKALATQLANVKTLSAHVDRSLAGQAESLAKVQGALGAVGGPVGRLGQLLIAPQKGFADLSQVMGASKATALMAAAGIGILVAAVAALTAAVVVGVVKIASWAAGLADASRSAGLARDAVEALNPSLAALSGEIDAVRVATGLSVPALQGIAKALKAAKVPAADLPEALRAAALAEAALGQGGAQEFLAQMQSSGMAVSKFATLTQQKLGGIVARQMLGLEAQGARFRSNIAALFGGLNIDPVLGGMQTLVALFDKTEASGRAVELLFGKVFQPLIDQAQNAAYVVEAFALGFLIGLTKLYIAIKPVIKTVSELFGFEDTSLADVLSLAKSAGEAFAIVFAGFTVILGGIIALFGEVAAVAMVFEGAVFAVAGAVVWLGSKLLGALGTAINAVKGYFAGINWSEIGTQIVAGIARGITGAAGSVLGAIGGVVSGAIAHAKSMLGIASPSKVFAEMGDYTGQGFVVGVEDQTENAQAAMAGLVEPPPLSALQSVDAGVAAAAPVAASAAEAAAPAVTSPQGGSKTIDLKGATFNFHGVADAKDAERLFGETLTRLLEGDALALGGSPA